MGMTSEGHCSRSARWMIGVAASVMAIGGMPAVANAQSSAVTIEISSQRLDRALLQLSRQANIDITAPGELTRGRTAPAVRGNLTIDDALARLLAGSGLSARRTGDRTYSIGRSNSTAQISDGDVVASEAGSEAEILVTGSRIRGAPPAAPVTTITQQQMRNAGQSDLGQVVRSIPQNFTGGQNPGIGSGAEGQGSADLNASTSVNLRGLGPAATLTLLNGRRLAYNGANQGVDITSIPMPAVDRVEIVADGASAIYGSDAVGGVVNVILRRDYSGASATAMRGGSTDGGYSHTQLAGTAGGRWGSGSVLFAADFVRSDPVLAGQRSYTDALHPTAMIYPSIEAWSALVSARQDVAPPVELQIVGLYSDRSSEYRVPVTTTGDYLEFGTLRRPRTRSYLINPSLELDLPGSWRGSASFTYGREQTDQPTTVFLSGDPIVQIEGGYTNRAIIGEVNAQGDVVSLPSGNVSVAVGGGYRRISFQSLQVNGPVETRIAASRNSYYGFAELLLPVVSPRQSIRGIHRLNITAAVRYESYSDFGDIATPRVTIVYEPAADVGISGTWGRSFRTPTLLDQYRGAEAQLYRATSFGGPALPATVLYLDGGNRDLRPERSENFTLTGSLHPTGMPGLRLDLSYFNIDYSDRIAAPIPSFAGTLSNPIYSQFVTPSPSLAVLNNVISQATLGFLNFSPVTYDPANVVAVVDGRFQNVVRQRVDGLDASLSYRAAFGQSHQISANVNATYMRIRQSLTEDAPELQLAGEIFNPPRWRMRAGATWEHRSLTLSAFANYLGRLLDNRPTSTISRISAQTTVDLVGSWRVSLDRSARELRFQLSAINLFNAKPDRIWTPAGSTSTPFDSTNYKATGRVVSITAGVSW